MTTALIPNARVTNHILNPEYIENRPQNVRRNLYLPAPQPIAERHIGSTRLILLAPGAPRATRFRHVVVSGSRYEARLAEMQRLRGRIYLEDGAIQRWQLSANQRHQVETDCRSWHLLVTDAQGRVCGCARYLPYDPETPFEKLEVRKAAIAQSPEWSHLFRAAMEAELAEARRRRIAYVEVGGWAIDEQHRCTRDCLHLAMAAYALAQMLGDGIGVTTATVRHGSAGILQKIGGRPLECDAIEIPSYFDPQYDCEMQLLRFDSRIPNPRYQEFVDRLRADLESAPVICRQAPSGMHRVPFSPPAFPLDVPPRYDYGAGSQMNFQEISHN